MSTSAVSHHGVELTSKGVAGQAARTLLAGSLDEPSQRHARRRATLADWRRDLQRQEDEKPDQHRRAKAALAVYTLARVAANVWFLLWPSSRRRYYSDGPDSPSLILDSILRPLITGLGVFVFLYREDRFSANNPLQVWSFAAAFCLTLPVCDLSGEEVLEVVFMPTLLPAYAVTNGASILWEVCCNLLQVHMTTMKLQALGRNRTARVSRMLTKLGTWSLIALFPLWLLGAPLPVWLSVSVCFSCTFLTIGIQCGALILAACSALVKAWGDDDETIRWTACLLLVNSLLILLGPAISFAGLFVLIAHHLGAGGSPRIVVTVDVSFQVCNVLLLSGMVGPRLMNLETLKKIAELSGFGLASKRIAFPGHISRSATDCIVSFPGKYSESWDRAVSSVQKDAYSLACVFLTDADAGLGKHASNPATPGKCWCQQIYGPIPASAYLSVVETSAAEQNSNQKLAFAEADAKAMGQRLLIKQDQGEMEWEQELAEALRDAEKRCAENHELAPWGCQWFEDWKNNVDRAEQHHQTLHVFYFEGCKGKGKMLWDQLSDKQARQDARKSSGLGASQTSEVAYLDKVGLSYVEHDITEFEDFLASHS
ncbi:unnamed protein product [Symbiodinium sp. CCMP2592]|nr:unnamed protein product [Symbiodinium sp. CCMP2592]